MYYSLRNKSLVFFIIIFFSLVGSPVYPENYKTITYSATIKDDNGNLVNKTLKFRFIVYDSSNIICWTRDRFVQVKEGKLNVLLGKTKRLKDSFFDNNHSILSFVVKGDQLIEIGEKVNLVSLINLHNKFSEINSPTGGETEGRSISFQNHGYSINAYYHYNNGNVNLWKSYIIDFDQEWNWENDNLRLYSTDYCLNAYKPGRGTNVDVYYCDQNDPDQHWDWVDIGYGYEKGMIQLKNTNLCLNAHNVRQGSNLNLWKCNQSDPEQLFIRTINTGALE